MPARSYSRLKKGGNSLSVPDELNDLENSLKSIKSDVDLALEKIKSLGEKIQSKEEKEEVEKSDDILLNSYGASGIEMSDGWFYSAELKNEKNFIEEEKSEILLSICTDEEEDVCYNNCDVDVMEENGWYLDDTEYSIVSGCILEE